MTTRKGGWTAEHLRVLTEDYATKGAAHVSALTGHSVKGTIQKAGMLGIKNVHAWRGGRPYTHKQPVLRHAGSSVRIEASAPKRGPAYLPGELDTLPRSADFRHVVYPSPPAPTRTNTFTHWG